MDTNNPLELQLRSIRGHVVTEVGESTYLIDTGSPLSFGFGPDGTSARGLRMLSPGFRPPALAADAVQVVGSVVHQHVSGDISGVLGMDILAELDSRFNLRKGSLTLSRSRNFRQGDFILRVALFNGLPLVGPFVIAGRAVRALWDSGASTGYLVDPRLFQGADFVCEREDFHPLSARSTFTVRVHSVPVEFASEEGVINLQMALLPEFIDSGRQHILGSELLKHYEISLCSRDGLMFFTRQKCMRKEAQR